MNKLNRETVFAYFFGICSFLLFFNSTFISEIEKVREQGMHWFIISFICFLFPMVNKVKFRDVEIEFIQEIKKIEQKITEFHDEFVKSMTEVKEDDKNLSPELIEKREKLWDEQQKLIENLDEELRFEFQRNLSLLYMTNYNLTVKELKEKLHELKFYQGKILDFGQNISQKFKAIYSFDFIA